MLSFVNSIKGSSKHALLLVSIIAVITIVDSQIINIFYGTRMGTPNYIHLLLFILTAVIASVINIILLELVKASNVQSRSVQSPLLKLAYITASVVQYVILTILLISILQMRWCFLVILTQPVCLAFYLLPSLSGSKFLNLFLF